MVLNFSIRNGKRWFHHRMNVDIIRVFSHTLAVSAGRDKPQKKAKTCMNVDINDENWLDLRAFPWFCVHVGCSKLESRSKKKTNHMLRLLALFQRSTIPESGSIPKKPWLLPKELIMIIFSFLEMRFDASQCNHGHDSHLEDMDTVSIACLMSVNSAWCDVVTDPKLNFWRYLVKEQEEGLCGQSHSCISLIVDELVRMMVDVDSRLQDSTDLSSYWQQKYKQMVYVDRIHCDFRQLRPISLPSKEQLTIRVAGFGGYVGKQAYLDTLKEGKLDYKQFTRQYSTSYYLVKLGTEEGIEVARLSFFNSPGLVGHAERCLGFLKHPSLRFVWLFLDFSFDCNFDLSTSRQYDHNFLNFKTAVRIASEQEPNALVYLIITKIDKRTFRNKEEIQTYYSGVKKLMLQFRVHSYFEVSALCEINLYAPLQAAVEHTRSKNPKRKFICYHK